MLHGCYTRHYVQSGLGDFADAEEEPEMLSVGTPFKGWMRSEADHQSLCLSPAQNASPVGYWRSCVSSIGPDPFDARRTTDKPSRFFSHCLGPTSELPRRAGLRRFHAGMKKKAFAVGGRWAYGEGESLKRVLGGLNFPPRIPLPSSPPPPSSTLRLSLFDGCKGGQSISDISRTSHSCFV